MIVAKSNVVHCSEVSGSHVSDYALLFVTPCSLKMCTEFLVDHTVFALMVEA